MDVFGSLMCDGEKRERKKEWGRKGKEDRPWWIDSVEGGGWHQSSYLTVLDCSCLCSLNSIMLLALAHTFPCMIFLALLLHCPCRCTQLTSDVCCAIVSVLAVLAT